MADIDIVRELLSNADWNDERGRSYSAHVDRDAAAEITALRASNAKMEEALRELRNAGQEVMDGLHRRIDDAPKHAVPVFSGIALLHGALHKATAVLSSTGTGKVAP